MNFSRRVDWNKTWFLCFKTNTLFINLLENLQRYKETVRGNWHSFFTSYKTMFLVFSNFDFQFLTMISRGGQYFYRFSSACRLIEYNSSYYAKLWSKVKVIISVKQKFDWSIFICSVNFSSEIWNFEIWVNLALGGQRFLFGSVFT